jgi:hypothetical protein
MKIKRAIVLCALMIFSLGSLAVGHAAGRTAARMAIATGWTVARIATGWTAAVIRIVATRGGIDGVIVATNTTCKNHIRTKGIG